MPIPEIPDITEEEELDFEEELKEGYAEIEQKFAVDSQEGFDNVVVLDNVPITSTKGARLIERLRSVIEKAGAAIEEENVQMPWDDEAGTNKGFVFLVYPDAPQAANALRVLDGIKFGKNYLHANRFGDIERYANMPVGEGELPAGWQEKPYVEKDHLRSWLGDQAGRDQYITFRDQDVNLYWNGRNGKADVVRDADGKVVKNSVSGRLRRQVARADSTEMGRLLPSMVSTWYLPRLAAPSRCRSLVRPQA